MGSYKREGMAGVRYTIPLSNGDLAIGAIHDFAPFIKALGHGRASVNLESGQAGQVGAIYAGRVQTGNGGILFGTPQPQAILRYTITAVSRKSITWDTNISSSCVGTAVSDTFVTTATINNTPTGSSILEVNQVGGPNVGVGVTLYACLGCCCGGICCPCAIAAGLAVMFSSQNEDHVNRIRRTEIYLQDATENNQIPSAVAVIAPEQVSGPVYDG